MLNTFLHWVSKILFAMQTYTNLVKQCIIKSQKRIVQGMQMSSVCQLYEGHLFFRELIPVDSIIIVCQ